MPVGEGNGEYLQPEVHHTPQHWDIHLPALWQLQLMSQSRREKHCDANTQTKDLGEKHLVADNRMSFMLDVGDITDLLAATGTGERETIPSHFLPQ